jgi:hypothetical protein
MILTPLTEGPGHPGYISARTQLPRAGRRPEMRIRKEDAWN